jgi:hypothetical protein
MGLIKLSDNSFKKISVRNLDAKKFSWSSSFLTAFNWLVTWIYDFAQGTTDIIYEIIIFDI